MFRASIAALLGVSMFAGAQVASAQSAGVSEEEIHCFVSGCDEATATDAKDATQGGTEAGAGEDECMVSGVCPVGETRGFHLSANKPAAGKAAPSRTPSAKPAPVRNTATRYTGNTGGVSSARVGKMAMPATRKSLDMRLSFELGSAQLTPDARQQADIFARQLKEAAGAREFVIEGHTDSIGSPAYNRQLSRERAQAVVNYLVGQGVSKTKLRAVGYGFDHPRDGTRSSDPSNRRVEIVRY